MIGSSRSYAIGRAHFQIAGGVRSLLTVCGVYVVLVCAGIALYYYADLSSGRPTGLTSVAISLLLGIETVALVVFGAFRVAGAIRSDLTSRMIESHRLMPVPSWRAVAGYLFGPTTHAMAFGLLNLLLAYILAGWTHTSFGEVTLGQATLFAFAFLVWSAVAVGTFLARYIVFVGAAVMLLSGCSLGLYWAYVIFPALALLTSPMIGHSIFAFGRGTAGFHWVYPLSFLAQGIFFGLFFAGACRRYRGTYATTFSELQALILVLAWSFASAAGIAVAHDFRLMPFEGDQMGAAKIIGSLFVGLALTIVPLRTCLVVERKGAAGILSGVAMMVATAVAVSAMAVGAVGTQKVTWWHFAMTGLVSGAYVVTLYALLRMTRRLRWGRSFLIVSMGMGLLLCVPLALEVGRMMALSNAGQEATFGKIGNFSAWGALINVWGIEHGASAVPGLVWQWGVALVLLVMALVVRRRRKEGAAVAAAPVAAAGAES